MRIAEYEHKAAGQEQKFIPLDKIQDITIQQNWLQKKFGICNVVIETAGQAGPEVGASSEPR